MDIEQFEELFERGRSVEDEGEGTREYLCVNELVEVGFCCCGIDSLDGIQQDFRQFREAFSLVTDR